MLSRFLDWLGRKRYCEHVGADGLSTWEPYFYGRTYESDQFVVIDVCSRCGSTLARVP